MLFAAQWYNRKDGEKMHPKIQEQLLELNRKFYTDFGAAFSEKRWRIQPGVARVLEAVGQKAKVLDVGCGNGGVLAALLRRGFSGVYVGVDFSPELLAAARRLLKEYPEAMFLERDVTLPHWHDGLPSPFDFVFAFSVLHHIPGEGRRERLLAEIRSLLPSGGLFVHSHWQFLNSPRLRARIQPWEKAGIDPDAVDPNDYLLDWRHRGAGLRYVHLFSEEELRRLAAQTGFRIHQTFYSDGEGGRLGLYQIWEAE